MKANIRSSELEDSNNLAAEHNFVRSILNASPDLVSSVDRDFNVLFSNDSYNKTLGSRLRKNSKKSNEVLAFQLHFLSLYERAFSGESFVEVEYTDAPVEKWLEISYRPIHSDGAITSVCCYGHDVTSLKKEITFLKLLESVVTDAPDAILITDTKPFDSTGPKIIYANPALLKMTGYTKGEILGQTPNFLIGPNSDRKQLDHLRRCFESSEPCEIEIVNYKKDGGEFWIHVAMAPVADSDGVFTHYIAIGRDITERLKNIQSIKDQNLRLSEIARIQSHEVRGPLARIKGLIDLLSNYSSSMDCTSTAEIINFLKISSKEMDEVIKKIIINTEEIIVAEPLGCK
jgi:PAS domain S-box-containing protein